VPDEASQPGLGREYTVDVVAGPRIVGDGVPPVHANSRLPSGAAAVTSASVQEWAPEQYCLVPSSRQPRAVLLAVSLGPGGCAAQTPQRLPAGGA
jgi:hypothetical protein